MSKHPPVTPEYVLAWGKHAHGSPLYRRLVEVVAASQDLMRVLNRMENQPRPNLLFAGVHFLLAQGADPDLACYYASLVDEPLSPDGVGQPFSEFVLANEETLVEIGRTRLTQTNECRRCAVLLPGIWLSTFDRFHLIDLGTSAGLNLALDRYAYRWNSLTWGDGSLTIDAESRGEAPKPRDINVLSRTGLDLHPVDITSPEERRWLDALIWPELSERRHRLTAALDVLAAVEHTTLAGDALATLPPVLDGLPAGEPAVILNSFVLIQFTPEEREKLDEMVHEARSRRPVYRVSMEVLVKTDDWARVAIDDGSGWEEVGQAHPHGEWVEFFR